MLIPLLAGSLAVGALAPAQAAAPDTGTGKQHYSAGTYLIRMTGEPVASYTGGTDGLKATKPERGKRLDIGTRSVRAYQEHLQEQRADVLAGVRGVKPLYTYDVVVNGFAARLTAAQANRLARTPGVASLTRNETVPLARTAEADAGAGSGAGAAVGTPAGTAADTAPGTSARTSAGTLPVPDTAAFLGLKGEKGLYSKVSGGQRNAGGV